MPELPAKFWDRHPVNVAAELIGCTLSMQQDGSMVRGRIIETEAYHHEEAACHAFGFEHRKEESDRVAHFFGPAGVTYVYLNYGIHKLLNVITGPGETGSGVLIRAIEPLEGIDAMRINRGNVNDRDLCNGPGKLTQAFGIDMEHNKLELSSDECPIVFMRSDSKKTIERSVGPRVGIKKATDLPWRFVEKGNPGISKAKENRLLKPESS